MFKLLLLFNICQNISCDTKYNIINYYLLYRTINIFLENYFCLYEYWILTGFQT